MATGDAPKVKDNAPTVVSYSNNEKNFSLQAKQGDKVIDVEGVWPKRSASYYEPDCSQLGQGIGANGFQRGILSKEKETAAKVVQPTLPKQTGLDVDSAVYSALDVFLPHFEDDFTVTSYSDGKITLKGKDAEAKKAEILTWGGIVFVEASKARLENSFMTTAELYQFCFPISLDGNDSLTGIKPIFEMGPYDVFFGNPDRMLRERNGIYDLHNNYNDVHGGGFEIDIFTIHRDR